MTVKDFFQRSGLCYNLLVSWHFSSLGPLTNPETLSNVTNPVLKMQQQCSISSCGPWVAHEDTQWDECSCFQFTSHALYLEPMISCSLNFSHHMFSFCLHSPPFCLILAVPLLSLWSPCLSSNSLMGVLREEVDVLSPDCMENSSKRHEAKSLNQGDWLLFPLSSSWTTIDDCPRGLRGWQCLIGWLFLRPCVGACKCGIVGSAIVCSSFRKGLIPTWKRCWAGVQEQRQGGAPGSPGDPISKQRNSVTESGYLFVCMYLNTAYMWNNMVAL